MIKRSNSQNILFCIQGCSVIRKAHHVFVHVKHFCESRGKGLGHFSEQTFERMHSRFNKFSRYRLPKENKSRGFSESLLKVTKELNVLQLG